MLTNSELLTNFLEISIFSIILSASWVIILINFLYRLRFTAFHLLAKDKSNEQFFELHQHKRGTPTMGGILIWLTFPLVCWIFLNHNSTTIFIVLSFLGMGFLGFVDGLIDMYTKYNPDFRLFQEKFEWRLGKLIIMYIANVIVGFGLIYYLNIKFINILDFKIDFTYLKFIWPFILGFFSLVSLYSSELIDGLDALAAGLFCIMIIGWLLMLIAVNPSATLVNALAALLGVMIVYLYFNIPPARFFMGGPGAMPTGVLFFILAIITNNVVFWFLSMLLFFATIGSSFIQIMSMKFFKKRVFKIAPLHHHFEALGWPEYKVVMRYWLFQAVFVIIGILVQLLVG